VRLLVTGGAGYIGSVVTAQLLERGHDVVVLDDLSTGHADAVPEGAELVTARVHDVAEVLDTSFEAVLHFAARSVVAESVHQPEIYWENNVVGSLALLTAMRRHRVRRLVFSSTAATYGQPTTTPITEDAPAVPINPYGHSKLAIDFALADEAMAHGLHAVSLRYFNVGGALGGFGERHQPETHLIPNVLAVPLGQREAVDVFGADYSTADGTAVRDYLHVVDLGRAHLMALEAMAGAAGAGEDAGAALPRPPGPHRVYNLGSGTGYSVAQVVQAARDVTGHDVPVRHGPRRAGDPPALVASSARIGAELGWRPELGLHRIVSDAWAFLTDGRASCGGPHPGG